MTGKTALAGGGPMMRRSQQLPVPSHIMLYPFLMAALLVLFLAAKLTGAISSQLWPVVVAAAAGVFCIIECRLAGLSWAHPRIMILGYVVMACSIPPVYLHLQPYSKAAQTFATSFRFLVSPEAPLLMAFTILATGVGLSLQSYQPRQIVPPPEGEFELEDEPQAIKRHRIGRVVLAVVSLSLLFQGVTTGTTYGGEADQVVFAFEHEFVVIRQFSLLAAVAVVYSSRLQLRLRPGKASLDHFMVALALLGCALIGSRNTMLALVLMLFVLKQPRKETKLSSLVLTLVAGAMIFAWIATYRSTKPVETGDAFTLSSVWDTVVTDLSSIAGTTGVVHSLVPAIEPFAMGATLAGDLMFLIPSSAAIALFGQVNTGAFKFRQLLQLDNPYAGLGFSLPAEGLLNFGLLGLIGVMIICGWLYSFLWRRFNPYRAEVLTLAYSLVAANFPFFLRSDLLALMKGSLYPLAIAWLMIQIADRVPTSRADKGDSRALPLGRAWSSSKVEKTPRE